MSVQVLCVGCVIIVIALTAPDPPLLLHLLLVPLRGVRSYLLGCARLVHEFPHLVHADASRVLAYLANGRHKVAIGEYLDPTRRRWGHLRLATPRLLRVIIGVALRL